MTNDEYIEIYNRFAELPDRLKATEQQRESAEQFARFLNEKQADIEPYSAVCAEIEQLCTSGDVGSNEIYDKIRHEIESLKELTVALEQMNDAEAAISCSDMASITAESQRLQVFCNKEMTLKQVSDTIERVKKMTDSLKKAFKKEIELLYEIVDKARSSIWHMDAQRIRAEIESVGRHRSLIWRKDAESLNWREDARAKSSFIWETSVVDDSFLSELKKSISDAQKKRQNDIDEMLKKHKCLREGGRFYKKHNEILKHNEDYSYYVEKLLRRNNAIIGIICSSIGVLLSSVAIFLSYNYWGNEPLFVIIGSLCLMALVTFLIRIMGCDEWWQCIVASIFISAFILLILLNTILY